MAKYLHAVSGFVWAVSASLQAAKGNDATSATHLGLCAVFIGLAVMAAVTERKP